MIIFSLFSSSAFTDATDFRRLVSTFRCKMRSVLVIVFRLRPRPFKFPMDFVDLYLATMQWTESRGINTLSAILRSESPLRKCLMTSSRKSLEYSFLFLGVTVEINFTHSLVMCSTLLNRLVTYTLIGGVSPFHHHICTSIYKWLYNFDA